MKKCVNNLRHLNISISSDISLSRINGSEEVMVEKVFKYKRNENIVFEEWGYWTEKQKFVITAAERILIRRRMNFKGMSLTTCIVVTHNDTLNHLTDRR